ncbi:ribose operon repressor [bacterium BMS3Abin05]|nr:ribose operon repressor [bacterium BMS3Abin05]GBE27928.1 ribose operon repressor [bacterium BMS3Bbin03]
MKRVTLKQIAEELGLSVMTVSRALSNHSHVNGETRRRILAAANRLGYRPNYIAKSLVLQKTYTIGVVVPEITHSFFPEVIRGIEEVTYNAGYQLILTHSAENAEREKNAISTLEAKRVDGVLISTVQTVRDYSVYKELIRLKLPVVFFDRCVYNIGASCVSINDRESSQLITQHLIDHGYKKIAHLKGSLRVSISRARLAGFKSALLMNNLEIEDHLIVNAGFHEKGGYKAMKQLLTLPSVKRPRAVVAVNDPAAFGAMEAIYEKGLKIPEDIAIVGFSDDIRAPLMPTPLTTIRQPAYEIGKAASQKLIDIIEDRNIKPEKIVIDGDIIIRKSCGCR